ncbi:hypothetical protein ERJ75_000269700 [Trypanosoma vivax]|nr:hypothetical protein ERJ75_000269700 [Trypanosoma vivax]
MDQTLDQGSRGRGWGGRCARRFSRHFGTGVAKRQGKKGTTHWQSAKAGTSTYDSMGGKDEGRTREGIEAPEAHSKRHSVTQLGTREKRRGRNEEGSQKGLGEPEGRAEKAGHVVGQAGATRWGSGETCWVRSGVLVGGCRCASLRSWGG